MTPTKVIITRDFRKQAQARSVPDAVYDPSEKAYVVFDPSPRAAAAMLKMFPALADEYPWLSDIRASLTKNARPTDNATAFGARISAATGFGSYYEYQDIDLGYVWNIMRRHGAAYIGWERGLGKTLATISLIQAENPKRVLIVCPNTAKVPVWKDEIAKWMPSESKRVVVMGNTKRQRQIALEAAKADDTIFITHYEALALVKNWGEWDLVVCDEAHRIKNTKAQRTRALKKIKTRYKLALSGSIVENNLEELFSPLQWMYPKHYSSKWRDWNDRYLDYIDNGSFGKICLGVKPGMLDALRDELGVFMVYRRKEDELDLPEKTEQTLYVDLSKKQRAAYNELRESYLTILDSGEPVAASTGLVLLTRLRQIASGLSLVSEEITDSCKLDLVEDLIRDSAEPTVVFTWFKASAEGLSERLTKQGVEHFVTTGDTKAQDRTDRIAAFQGGRGKVFIGTISTLGESVNLHRASQAIFVDRSWNPAQNAQAADRIYRIGQESNVTITHIVSRDTVDETRVQPILNDKEALRKLILGD